MPPRKNIAVAKPNAAAATTSLRVTRELLQQLGEVAVCLPIPSSANALGVACINAVLQAGAGDDVPLKSIVATLKGLRSSDGGKGSASGSILHETFVEPRRRPTAIAAA